MAYKKTCHSTVPDYLPYYSFVAEMYIAAADLDVHLAADNMADKKILDFAVVYTVADIDTVIFAAA